MTRARTCPLASQRGGPGAAARAAGRRRAGAGGGRPSRGSAARSRSSRPRKANFEPTLTPWLRHVEPGTDWQSVRCRSASPSWWQRYPAPAPSPSRLGHLRREGKARHRAASRRPSTSPRARRASSFAGPGRRHRHAGHDAADDGRRPEEQGEIRRGQGQARAAPLRRPGAAAVLLNTPRGYEFPDLPRFPGEHARVREPRVVHEGRAHGGRGLRLHDAGARRRSPPRLSLSFGSPLAPTLFPTTHRPPNPLRRASRNGHARNARA